MVVIFFFFFLQYKCIFLAYKGPEVDGPGLVTHANEHLFQRLSEIWPTACQIKHFFLSPYDKPKSYSYKTEITTTMYCMQRPGKTEGTAGTACLLNEISKGSHARSQDKKIFQQPSLSVWSWGQDNEGGFSLTANPAVVLNGQVSRRVPCSALAIWQCWARESSSFTPAAVGFGTGRRGSTDQ